MISFSISDVASVIFSCFLDTCVLVIPWLIDRVQIFVFYVDMKEVNI